MAQALINLMLLWISVSQPKLHDAYAEKTLLHWLETAR